MAKTKPCWAKVTGPLAEYAPGFRDELFRLGYTPLTAACQLRLAAHLSRWMTAEELGTQDLDMPAAERYFAARRSAGYANERTVEALGPLLGYLRRLGAAPLPAAEPVTEASLLLDRFAAYLTVERGLVSVYELMCRGRYRQTCRGGVCWRASRPGRVPVACGAVLVGRGKQAAACQGDERAGGRGRGPG